MHRYPTYCFAKSVKIESPYTAATRTRLCSTRKNRNWCKRKGSYRKIKAAFSFAPPSILSLTIYARKYFYPITTVQECYGNNYTKAEVPIAQNLADKVLVLPIYTGLQKETMDRILELICWISRSSIRVKFSVACKSYKVDRFGDFDG